MLISICMFFYEWYVTYRDLHVLTHTFPTLRSSDLHGENPPGPGGAEGNPGNRLHRRLDQRRRLRPAQRRHAVCPFRAAGPAQTHAAADGATDPRPPVADRRYRQHQRSEEHTSELQSLMSLSYAVFCLKQHKITQLIHK